MSPCAALMSAGLKVNDPLASPTWTTCTLTPAEPVDAATLPLAELDAIAGVEVVSMAGSETAIAPSPPLGMLMSVLPYPPSYPYWPCARALPARRRPEESTVVKYIMNDVAAHGAVGQDSLMTLSGD